MGCACGGRSARSAAGQQQDGEQQNAGGAYEFEATYNDGSTQSFATEQEVMAALSFKGGGYRMVPRSR